MASGELHKLCTSPDVVEEREKFFSMTLDEKRSLYRCGSKFVTLDSIPTWAAYCVSKHLDKDSSAAKYSANRELNNKVSVFVGDITALEIDAIVNAANNSLMGGGGVDGAIHRGAGPQLRTECGHLDGCSTGDAKITAGYNLPAKYIIHAVGPVGEQEEKLRSCYKTVLSLVQEYNLQSVAFPCISTGTYRYDNEKAAHVALDTVRKWLETEKYGEKMIRVIFCLFLNIDVQIYEKLLLQYFPL